MDEDRDRLIKQIIETGMLRRDVATDIADAILARWRLMPRTVVRDR